MSNFKGYNHECLFISRSVVNTNAVEGLEGLTSISVLSLNDVYLSVCAKCNTCFSKSCHTHTHLPVQPASHTAILQRPTSPQIFRKVGRL